MIYDGVVLKLNKLYLFIINPDTNKLMDGINISEHKCYDSLTGDQLMVVTVNFKDGTQDIDKVDLDEFIYGDSYGEHDTFLYIQDKKIYTFSEEENIKKVSLLDIVNSGELPNVAHDCIIKTKELIND